MEVDVVVDADRERGRRSDGGRDRGVRREEYVAFLSFYYLYSAQGKPQ
jgi:hypothetical protein